MWGIARTNTCKLDQVSPRPRGVFCPLSARRRRRVPSFSLACSTSDKILAWEEIPDAETPNVIPDSGKEASSLTDIQCGNGIREEGETCDDGNAISGDGCSATCRIEKAPPPISVRASRSRSRPPPILRRRAARSAATPWTIRCHSTARAAAATARTPSTRSHQTSKAVHVSASTQHSTPSSTCAARVQTRTAR